MVRAGRRLATDFLDLRSRISSGGERGLLGLAFAPDYASSGRFFVNFTNPNGHTVVARFRRSSNPSVADAGVALRSALAGAGVRLITQPFANHNGGHLAFGPDGYLYIGLGDGGSGNDPDHRAQNPAALLGKMLRIDVNVPDTHPIGYRVPADNPFLSGGPLARGRRSGASACATRGGTASTIRRAAEPARWSSATSDRTVGGDRLRTGGPRRPQLRLAQSRRGARQRHARARRHFSRSSIRFTSTAAASAQSITGGYVYRGARARRSFRGRYFFADFVTGGSGRWR